MHRRSTLWFVITTAWFVLLVLNLLHHHDKNTLVIAIAVAGFLAVGVAYRRHETKAMRNRKLT